MHLSGRNGLRDPKGQRGPRGGRVRGLKGTRLRAWRFRSFNPATHDRVREDTSTLSTQLVASCNGENVRIVEDARSGGATKEDLAAWLGREAYRAVWKAGSFLWTTAMMGCPRFRSRHSGPDYYKVDVPSNLSTLARKLVQIGPK